MLTVYGRATSSNVQALLWGLEELDLSYTRLDFGETFGGLDTPKFRAMNPHGKIPVLKIGDTALFETGAILRYLANTHGAETFWPSVPIQRAKVDMWAEWAKHSVAEAFTGPIFWEAVRKREKIQNPVLIRHNIEKLETELAIAEELLENLPYLCGNFLTLADIQFGHVLYRYFQIDIQRRELPVLEAYYTRLKDRPAFQKTIMVSYDVLKNTL